MRWNGTRDLQKNQEKRLIDESPKPLKSVVKFALVTVSEKVEHHKSGVATD
ncbi:prophage integrase [Escherichia coli]|nr:prophage integrase [Escherichia coli]